MIFWSMIRTVLQQWKDADRVSEAQISEHKLMMEQEKEWYCSATLRPPAEYTRKELTTILDDFTSHTVELENINGLREVINSVFVLLQVF